MTNVLKGYRSQALQAFDPDQYLADRRAGMGDSESEIAYLARLRQRMSVAKRTKHQGDYRRARREYDSYQAEKQGRQQASDRETTESQPDVERVRRARRLVREAVDTLTRIDRELEALMTGEA